MEAQVKRHADSEGNAEASHKKQYGVVSLSPLPDLMGDGLLELDAYVEQRLRGCHELALAWASEYLDLELILLGSVLGRLAPSGGTNRHTHTQGLEEGEAQGGWDAGSVATVRHVVCVYTHEANGLGEPLPQEEDVGHALFMRGNPICTNVNPRARSPERPTPLPVVCSIMAAP